MTTTIWQNPIAVIVGPIGNIQIGINFCEDIDLSCEDTFAPEVMTHVIIQNMKIL